MFLSIVIPAFNVEKYIAECLDSCMCQDVSNDEYEVICVDDGSTDRTGLILDDYERRCSNISVIHQANHGLPSARNTGLDRAIGDYIWFVDSDDVIEHNCLGVFQEAISKSNQRVDRYFVKMSRIIDTSEVHSQSIVDSAKYYYTEVPGSLFRREYLKQNNLRFHPKMYYGEDVLFRCEFEEHESNSEYIDILAYYYRYNPNSQQHGYKRSKEKLKKYINSYIFGAKTIKDHYENNPRNSSQKAFLIVYCLCCAYMETTVLPKAEEQAYLDEVKTLGLYPMKKPADLKEKDMRFSTRTDFVGRILKRIDNIIFFHCTTRIGYRILKIRNRLYRKIVRLRGR